MILVLLMVKWLGLHTTKFIHISLELQ